MKNGIQNVGFRFRGRTLFAPVQVKNGWQERITLLRSGQVVLPVLMLIAFVAAMFLNTIDAGATFAVGAAAFTVEQTAEIETLLKGVGDKHKSTIKSEIEIAIKAASFDKDLGEKLTKQFNDQLETLGVKADVIKTLLETVQKQGEEMRKFESGLPVNGKTVEQLIEEKAADIAKIQHNNPNTNVKIIIPNSAIVKTQVARAAVSGSTMAMRLAEVGQLPYLGMKMSNLFRHAQVDASSNGVIRFYDQNAITRAAAPTAEGASAPESVINWIERLLKVEKITDSIPVTKEAWRQIYFIQSEIDRLLNLNLPLKEDQQLWSGTGATPEITGVYTNSTAVAMGTAYAGVTYAGTVAFANIYDLIATMRVIIMNSKQSKYSPNAVLMNPADILAYKLIKDSFGRYLVPGFVTADGKNIDGCEVIESSQVTANTLLVGDTRYGTIYDDGAVEMEMGYINDQMVKGAMTIMATKFHTLLIRNVDADAFLKCTDIRAQVALLATV